MATVIDMARSQTNPYNYNGGLFRTKISLNVGNSDVYFIPNLPILDIAIYQSGSSDIFFTNSSKADIEADSAIWSSA